MTIVRSFSLPFHSDQSVPLRGASQRNRVSVLLGVNGTQKSSVLRGLLEDALGSDSASKPSSSRPTCATEWSSSAPHRVIAISSAATDRFPARANFGEPRIRTRYDNDQYVYVGPRTGRNIVSRTQSVQSLIAEALQVDMAPSSVSEFIFGLSEKTTVPYVLRLHLAGRPFSGSTRTSRHPSSILEYLENNKSTAGFPRHRLANELIDQAINDRELIHEASQIFQAVQGSRLRGPEIDLNLCAANPCANAPFSARAIHFGLVTGFVSLRDVSLHGGNEAARKADEFSAGQWGQFSTLTTAALAVRDHTLFLVDEPENALHPAWQRDYISELLRAISHRKGCHLFLATHSPLIVSSLGAKDADLIGLRLNSAKAVEARLLDVPVGWQATDVLEDVFGLPSTRAQPVVSAIEAAMALIAEGAERNSAELRRITKQLIPLLDTLPEDDIARQVIASICRTSGVEF